MKLTDIAVNRYSFFAKKIFTGDEEKLWEDFKTRLELAIENIGGLKNTSQRKIVRQKAAQGDFVPIINSKKDSSEIVPITTILRDCFGKKNEVLTHRKLVSGVFLDAYPIQEWIGIGGKIRNHTELAEKHKLLKSVLPKYKRIDSEFWADCSCYFTELVEPTVETDSIFVELLQTETFAQVELPHSFFGISLKGNKSVAAILSKNYEGVEAKRKASKLFDELLREYFLCFAKINNEIYAVDELDAETARLNLFNYLEDDLKRLFKFQKDF